MTAQALHTANEWHIQHFPTLDSTSSHLLREADNGTVQPGTVIIADQQTGARGRQGRRWDAPSGGLYLSALIEDREGWGARWALITGLAIRQAISKLPAKNTPDIALKWPNDLLINNQKLCGILIERAGQADPWQLVIGIGVNVVKPSTPRESTAYLTDYIPNATPTTLTPLVLQALSGLRQQFAGKPIEIIRHAWLEHAWRLGGAVSCHVNGERVAGIFRDLDADGAMILERADGSQQRITGGEVHFGAEQTAVEAD
jgi:birA, biotin-[acetyl-CoA-carboxylase] ligase region